MGSSGALWPLVHDVPSRPIEVRLTRETDVQVTADATAGIFCNSNGWGAPSASVSCYDTAGNPADARFDIAVFDFPMRSGTRTAVIVSGLPVLEVGPPPQDGPLTFDLQDGHLLGYRLKVPIEHLPALVTSVLSVASRCCPK